MSTQTTKILVFSHRPEVRETIITAVGRRPAPDLSRVDYIEASAISDVLYEVEITNCPPVVVAVRRKDDRWLATWSQADAVLVHPLDPLAAAETVAEVLRGSAVPVVRG